MIAWFSTSEHAIRTIPVLQHDPDRPEDVDTESDDHVADMTRYASQSRPYVQDAPDKKRGHILSVGETNQVTIEDLWPERRPSTEERI